MSKQLDNWSFILALIGLGSIIFTILYLTNTINIWLIFLSIPISLSSYVGVVLGIIALIKKPIQKWKPITAIIIFLLTSIINAFLFMNLI